MEKVIKFETLAKIMKGLAKPEDLIKELLPIELNLTIFEKHGAIWIKIEHLNRKST